jgi:hypothetical protein
MKTCDTALIDRFSLRIWHNTKIALQRFTQMRVPAYGRSSVTGSKLRAHQFPVRRFITRQCLREARPLGTGAQQVGEACIQSFTFWLGPVLVSGTGQQISGVKVCDFDAPLRLLSTQGTACLILKAIRVNPHRTAGPQLQHATLYSHTVVPTQGLTRVVRCLAQVGASRIGRKFGPECIHDLLASQPVLRCKT